MARSGIMLCYPLEERRLEKWHTPVIAQPKLDGERCRAWIEDGKVILLSSEQKEIVSVPHINEALKSSGLDRIELDGELYIHHASLPEIQSIVGRTVNLHPEYSLMEYHIFDLVNALPQYQRIEKLKLLKSSLRARNIHFVDSVVAEGIDEVMRCYDNFIEQGYEGIIVRHLTAPYVRKRSNLVMKFKPKKSDTYPIIGYKEEVSKDGLPKNRLGSLICKGDDGTTFSVGSGLTDELRSSLWELREMLKGNLCQVSYQHLTPNHVPRFPVYVEVIWAHQESNYIGLGGESA